MWHRPPRAAKLCTVMKHTLGWFEWPNCHKNWYMHFFSCCLESLLEVFLFFAGVEIWICISSVKNVDCQSSHPVCSPCIMYLERPRQWTEVVLAKCLCHAWTHIAQNQILQISAKEFHKSNKFIKIWYSVYNQVEAYNFNREKNTISKDMNTIFPCLLHLQLDKFWQVTLEKGKDFSVMPGDESKFTLLWESQIQSKRLRYSSPQHHVFASTVDTDWLGWSDP